MTNFNVRYRSIVAMIFCGFFLNCWAQSKFEDYRLGPGDTIRIQVFQNPDLTLETRVSESGAVSYPLIGSVQFGGLTTEGAERLLAGRLKDGGFVKQPQVNVVLLANHGNQVSVLGQVNKPGRFPLETFNVRLTDILAIAGGIASTGSDSVIVSGIRNGKPFRKEVDITSIFSTSSVDDDIVLSGGDAVFVDRMSVFYIYGEAQRPGSYRIDRGMTIRQALSTGGGLTPRGTDYRIKVHRRRADGKIEKISPDLDDLVKPDDVIYVGESLF